MSGHTDQIREARALVDDLWPEGLGAVPGSYEVALKRGADTLRAALTALEAEQADSIQLTRDEAKRIRALVRFPTDSNLVADFYAMVALLDARLVAAEDRAGEVAFRGEEHVAGLEREASK